MRFRSKTRRCHDSTTNFVTEFSCSPFCARKEQASTFICENMISYNNTFLNRIYIYSIYIYTHIDTYAHTHHQNGWSLDQMSWLQHPWLLRRRSTTSRNIVSKQPLCISLVISPFFTKEVWTLSTECNPSNPETEFPTAVPVLGGTTQL